MPRISGSKPDATGRSSGALAGRMRKHLGPPKGQGWIWYTREMMESPAWSALSINGRRILDRLCLEHLAHAATENGNLISTHDQFRAAGISSSAIAPAIEELEFLGFIRRERGGRWAGKNTPSKYCLTWIRDRTGAAPSNEWAGVTSEQVKAWQLQRRQLRKVLRAATENQVFGKKSGGTVPRLYVVPDAKSDGLA